MIRVLLAGEGKTELGGRDGTAAFHTETPGVLEALLRRVRAEGWRIDGAIRWKDLRKFRAGVGAAERRNVAALILEAEERRCDVVAFSRDRDRDLQREADIQAGIAAASASGPRVVGGVAVETIEAWVLAILRERRSESPADPKARLAEGHGLASTDELVRVVEECDLASIPDDANSLRTWLERARDALHAR